MSISSRRRLGAVALALALMPLPRMLRAQVGAHLELLAQPPADVGTCLPDTTPAGRTPRRLRARQLVMASITPGAARREITLVTDSAGRPVRYFEDVSHFNGVDGGTGDLLVATLAPDGHWDGVRFHNATKVVNGGRGPGGHVMIPPPLEVRRTPSRPLSTAEQVRVRALAAWVARRCPA